MIADPDLRPVLTRWALRVCVVAGLALAYQIWSPDPPDWLWPLVAFYGVAMLAIWVGAWHFAKRKSDR